MLSHQRRQHALASAHTDLRPKLQPPARHERDVVIRSWLEHGKLCHERSDVVAAEQFYDAILRASPNHVEAQHLKLFAMLRQNRFKESLKLAKRLLVNTPEIYTLHWGLGVAQAGLQQFHEALRSFNRALDFNPNYIDALQNRGFVFGKLDRQRDALRDFERILSLAPENLDALNNSVNLYRSFGEPDVALALCQKSLSVSPNRADVLVIMGNILRDLNRQSDALICYNQAIMLNPLLAQAHNQLGEVLVELGQFEEAERAYDRAIEFSPDSCGYLMNFANAHRFVPGDPMLQRMLLFANTHANLSADDEVMYNYALGKAYSDLGEHYDAFRHFSKGAALKRSLIHYDETFVMSYFDRIEAHFTSDLIAEKTGSGDRSGNPIFVLGMPRSGSTLVEQIIASHPQVNGAGELPVLNTIAQTRTIRVGTDEAILYPDYVRHLGPLQLEQIGQDYLSRCRSFVASVDRLTDKMPTNFLYLGLIHLALPNARIIHTIRDPLDTCLSCFTNFFGGNVNYTYDLGELGRFYKRYQRLMEHWRRVLPEGAFIDVRYEDMVADTEAQARRLLDYCGLPWDDACLRFYEAKRLVKTASSRQVREPIYSRSVGRWRDYEPWLGPLKAELGIS